MNLQHEITNIANQLLNLHELRDWTFRFNTNKSRLGVCKYRYKRIEISIHLLDLGIDEVVHTIKHEIAHALVGSKAGHGPIWKKKAIELGCSPRACSTKSLKVKPRYIGTCPNGHVFNRHRRATRRTSCPKCCSTFNMNYLIEWKFSN